MKGFHKVKIFWFDALPLNNHEEELEEGWKPFGVVTALSGARIGIVCRRWNRSEEE